jgi:diguanylate cyclase (GGDEF)-like protein
MSVRTVGERAELERLREDLAQEARELARPRLWTDTIGAVAPRLSARRARAVLEREVGLGVFAEIDPVPLAAGSIAQIHRAVLCDGAPVVVKVRRPGLRRRLRSDIGALALAAVAAEHVSEDIAAANLPGFVELFAQLALDSRRRATPSSGAAPSPRSDERPCSSPGRRRGLQYERPRGPPEMVWWPEKDDLLGMNGTTAPPESVALTSTEPAFACPLTAVLLARVRRVAGEAGVQQLLRDAGSTRTVEYLEDLGNWITFDEAIALWDAGEAITADRMFARHVGEDALKFAGGTANAAVIRDLGSVEEDIRRLNVHSNRFSTVADLEAVEVRPGYAEVRAVAVHGFPRHRHHCEWTIGLLTLTSALFGLKPARVEHPQCQAAGAPDCRYHVSWESADADVEDSAQTAMLRGQVASLAQRLQGVFATVTDLISTDDLEDTLRRIADRAAHQVRAPRHLLAVRPSPAADVVCYHRGLDDHEAQAVAAAVFRAEEPPENWCVAEISSRHHRYGWLVALNKEGAEFLAGERELLELYARYAATALDNATALVEARSLLDLARRLATAGTSEEVVQRLADAIPAVIDCDRVAVSLWDEDNNELVRRAVNTTGREDAMSVSRFRPEDLPQLAAWLERPDPEPHFLDMRASPLKAPLREVGAVASVAVPIATAQRFLGTVHVSVRERPERLADTPELRDRLSGVAAHAMIALENGRLVDHITYQARHDQLTGLENRLAFGERITAATQREADRAKPFALFYIDLDRFKPVNDEFGHEVGDDLLCAVAERLRGCARPGDTVARLGGDEFAVIVEAIEDEAQLAPVAERFEHAFESPFVIDGHELTVEASIGRAVWPLDATDVEGLLRAADAIMYHAKRSRPDTASRQVGDHAGASGLSVHYQRTGLTPAST